ncbi:Gfo/Idh/MocA family oxidoreductase [uncultured Rubinisphaera sp.]|uniref:Gfo/Idh/MocA family protein n=1 Tax=uncultured Rubinisphaera sp. TaxID=1678686 RepID=UPI0030D876C2|tara:strand:- start:4269 stop:5609 length:1341 start_codon:yes stop_codon:yes gene_type:complete
MGLDHLLTRRDVLGATAGALAAACTYGLRADEKPASKRSALEQPRIALLGAGWRPDIKRNGRGIAIGKQAVQHAEMGIVCDVDSDAVAYACQTICQGDSQISDDYRKALESDDIDAVIIATPDHWHAKMSIEAMLAGKDVYCEKPATVTINEGRLMADVVKKTGRILQVGTQQRTESDHRFATAVALVQEGRIGKLQRIVIGVDPGNIGGPFQTSSPPPELNWNIWQGPAAEHDYIRERTHWTFRWWYEYAGGKLTDWGAHHVDIAQWAIGQLDSGPSRVRGQGVFHVPYENGYPTRTDTFNTPSTFDVQCQFPDDITMVINSGENGILFEGTEGRFFVNRGKLTGLPVERLKKDPLPKDYLERIYDGPPPDSHMANFFDCIKTRKQPVSDMASHQRTITTCHLANLTLRLGRELQWNPETETFINDSEADRFITRKARPGFEIQM